ncbi:glutamine synthetase family protein [Mycolicibacterium parafortuitum]|uniref:Glutamate--ammonia ligase [Leisingera methylohalidivorans DSM] n=1 Tax=Mycolicibacterium parafortuitum TaxID=39692 RepID=A0A375YM13_MYCPF|nr:glutamine synthetase family protein [Mycolicibacterium parafortuitum]ORB29967.1 glutamine synthetase [Mycolicibacterium parafortuitum]SRX82142.1 glutamate--ammonia ligase [Leisingera methylohalidivorans DSM] [Mycolicibacterium parafortuitum]
MTSTLDPDTSTAPHYAETLAEALPDDAKIAAVRAELEAAGVKYVLSCWIDLFGVPKTKPVPMSDFEALCKGKGPQFAVHSVSFVPELTAADSDQIPVPDLDAVYICPWDTSTAIIFADLFWEDKPYNVCPRQALKRTIHAAAQQGYVGYAGIEPEFIVMRYDENGRPVKAFDTDPQQVGGLRPRRQAYGYDVEHSLDAMPFLKDMMDMLEGLGWNLHDVVAEGAYSQFELDFHYTNLLEMADRLVFLRLALKEVAKRHGMFVTFMPKPTTGDWRSGAHINFSLRSVDAPDENLFERPGGGWSDESRYAVGGLLAHSEALTAITCPTVNSYNGLVPRVGGLEGGTVTWAPTNITYGHNNRAAQFRLPQSRYCIENRAADMCMNVYLALACTLAGSVEGIVTETDPGEPTDRDLYSMTAEEGEALGIRRLPRNLLDAVSHLQKDELIAGVLGQTMLKSYVAYKLDEWERYHQAVTDWEVEEYLRLY